MWTSIDKNFPSRGFSTPSPIGKSQKWSPGPPMRPRSEKKPRADDLFHVVHKVPSGDSPYVKAKHVQLIDKDPNRAISLFWAAINSGDRVASALKDMAVVMKQLNRSDEAIEAIKSFRHLCPLDSQESLDNILVELYKRSGRIEEQIEMLQHKVKNIEDGMAFGGKRTKSARSQGKKIQITVEQEYSRLLGNLAWAYLQQNNFKYAEELYRKALSLEPDRNKQCNLAICLMNMNRVAEAKLLLQKIRTCSSSPSSDGQEVDDSYAKSFERAIQMLVDLETQSSTMGKPRAAQEKENYTKEFQTPVRLPTNKRNSKESSVSSAIQAETESHHVSACTSAVGKRHDNAGGLQLDEHQSCSRDQHWNSGSVLGSSKYEFPKLPSNSSKTSHQTRNSNTDYLKKGWPYKENNIYGRSYFGSKMNEESGYSSPMDTTTAAGIQESPYTQPRRGVTKWSSASKEQRKEAFWVDGAVGGCSRKLSFEQHTGTTSDENFPLPSCSSGLSCITRERRNSSRGDTRVEAYNISSLQPIVHIEVENNMSREEDDSHQYECTAENIKPVLEFQNQTESQSVSGDFEKLHDNLTCKTKKSWADMVEEDEEELLSGTVHSPETKWICPSQESSLCFQTSFNGWNNEEEFTDENMDANIMCQTPTAPIDNQIENLSLNEKSFDIKESHTSSMSPKLTLRRSMFFDEQQQKPLLQKKVLNSEGCNSPQANENEYTSATGIKSTRRKRLQVFRDLTLSSDSPRS